MSDNDHRSHEPVIIPDGRHQGMPITRVPVSYLRWMISHDHELAGKARTELKRRGCAVALELEVTGHAIDRASLKCNDQWRRDRRDGEGLHAWLLRVSGEALRTCRRDGESVFYKRMKLVFAFDSGWPVLKTVIPDERKSARVRIITERSN